VLPKKLGVVQFDIERIFADEVRLGPFLDNSTDSFAQAVVPIRTSTVYTLVMRSFFTSPGLAMLARAV